MSMRLYSARASTRGLWPTGSIPTGRRSSIAPSSACSARRSRTVDLPFPITWEATAGAAPSSYCTMFTAARAFPARFAAPLSGAFWFPSAALTFVPDARRSRTAREGPRAALRESQAPRAEEPEESRQRRLFPFPKLGMRVSFRINGKLEYGGNAFQPREVGRSGVIINGSPIADGSALELSDARALPRPHIPIAGHDSALSLAVESSIRPRRGPICSNVVHVDPQQLTAVFKRNFDFHAGSVHRQHSSSGPLAARFAEHFS